MPLRLGLAQSRQQLRDQFISDLLVLTGDTRRIWLPKGTDTTTSTGESLSGATLTHGATLAGRLSSLGLGYMVSFNGTSDYSSFPDAADLSFNGTIDQAFSIVALTSVTDTAAGRMIVGKWNATGSNREWQLFVNSTDILNFLLRDESTAVSVGRVSDSAIGQGAPHLFVGTYDGGGGATAGNGMVLYQDGLAIASTASNNASYVAMEGLTAACEIGSQNGGATSFLSGSVGLTLVCQKQLSASEVWAIWKLCKSYFAL